MHSSQQLRQPLAKVAESVLGYLKQERLVSHIHSHLHHAKPEPPLSEERGAVIAEIIRLQLSPQVPASHALAIEPGQPFRLNLLEIVAQATQDPDLGLVPILKEGVPTGAFSELPPSGIWPPAQRSIDSSSDLDPQRLEHCAGNWTAAEKDPALLQQLVDKEVQDGFVALFPGTEADAAQHWPLGTAIGKLNIVQADGKDPRLVLDSTVCGLNPAVHIPERVAMPSALDVQRTFSTADPFAQLQGLSLDFKAAHKSQKVRPAEQGTLLFRVADKLYHYTVCHFGARFSAYWWQRTGSLILRSLHALLCQHPHKAWLYVDDILAMFRRQHFAQPVALTVAFLTALHAPTSWKKAQQGNTITWCGWTFCFRTETVALMQSKLQKLREQLQRLRKAAKVHRKDLEACLGLLNWATTLSPHMRSFMAPLYKDLHSTAGTLHSIAPSAWSAFYDCLDQNAKLGSTPLGSWLPRQAQLLEVGSIKIHSKADVPRVPPSHKHQWVRLSDPQRSEIHLKQDSKFVLDWLRLCFEHEQPRSLRTPPIAPCLSAADAFAEQHRIGIGGWLSTATAFVWYSEIFTAEQVREQWPQLGGPMQSYIACFEALAQLALAHCSWSLLRAKHMRFVLPSASDNTSAESGVNRLFTTTEPLSTFLRLAATWAHLHRVQFQVEHLAGEKNNWADALSRGRIAFVSHRSAERVRISLAQLAAASHTVSLLGDEHSFPPRLREVFSNLSAGGAFLAREALVLSSAEMLQRFFSAFVHGGITSIMNNVRFSTVAVFRNVQTTPHTDAHNCPESINHVFQISDFIGGRVILQDPEGEKQVEYQGKIVRGSPLEFVNHQARFCAKERLHWTESWSGGPRIVLIAYTARSLAKLSYEQTTCLKDLGFSLSKAALNPVPPPPAPSKQSETLILKQQPVALELFAGSAILSKALRASGFQTFAVDRHVAGAKAPILKVDLATSEGQGLVWPAFSLDSRAAYPPLLAERMAACVKVALESRQGVRLQPPVTLHDEAVGASHKQHKRHPPLIPEYREVQTRPASAPLPANGKLLSLSQVQGVVAAEGPFARGSVASTEAASERKEATDLAVSGDTKVVGLWHTPEEHFHKALSLTHPVDSFKPVAMVTKRAVDYVLGTKPERQNLDRRLFLAKLKLRAKELRPKEDEPRQSMAPHLRKVLGGKNLLLWKELLEQSGFDDLGVFRFMSEGVRVVGHEPHPKAFKSKLVPASLSEAELRESALQRRKALELLCAKGVSPEQRSQLMQATLEERDAGYLDGPLTASEVDALFQHQQWNAIRRFVLLQDGGKKIRPIDDALEGQLNAACCTSVQLELQDADYVTAQSLFIARRVAETKKLQTPGPWRGKCLDLTKAYKQVGVHKDHRDLMVILVPDASGPPTYFVSNSLIFGSVASVFSFNRISRSLWHLINHFLKVPSAVYFDDYPMLMPDTLADQADADVSEFLSILGWGHALTGKKGQPFMPQFDVLGMTLDVSALHQGTVTLSNKAGRSDRILHQLKDVQGGTGPFRHSLQVLTGLLNFASGFYAGRELRHVCHEFNQMLNQDRESLAARLEELVRQTQECIKVTPPRVLSCTASRRPILVWTDGAWEAGIASVGAVIYDTLTKKARVMGQKVEDEIVRSWTKPAACDLEQAQVISQVELFAMVCCREIFKHDWKSRRILMFVDNEAARFSAVKGGSVSDTMRDLVRLWDRPNMDWPALIWLERVPSYSNLADGPSRDDFALALRLTGADRAESFPCPEVIRQSLCGKRRV
ncbi:unnamed protein product [Symbiodinium sp. KB8]|nr:unnamed protein product [Symbiodinium sp. KB8]